VTALRLAHRGDWRRAPENTVPAMLAALRLPGCDGLEFDVRQSLDGVPVVVHDTTLARVQGLALAVADLTATELDAIGVPSLATVLAAVGRAPFLDIELKESPTEAGLDVIRAARAAPGGGLIRAVVSSFDAEVLAAVGRRYPAWPRWLNTRDLEATTIGRARDLGCDGIAALWRVIDASSSDRVRAAGLTLAAYTVRRRPTLARLERLGVSAICVEGPALDG